MSIYREIILWDWCSSISKQETLNDKNSNGLKILYMILKMVELKTAYIAMLLKVFLKTLQFGLLIESHAFFDVGSITDLIRPGEGCVGHCIDQLPDETYWEQYCKVRLIYSSQTSILWTIFTKFVYKDNYLYFSIIV